MVSDVCWPFLKEFDNSEQDARVKIMNGSPTVCESNSQFFASIVSSITMLEYYD